jgi:hypothetical protein
LKAQRTKGARRAQGCSLHGIHRCPFALFALFAIFAVQIPASERKPSGVFGRSRGAPAGLARVVIMGRVGPPSPESYHTAQSATDGHVSYGYELPPTTLLPLTSTGRATSRGGTLLCIRARPLLRWPRRGRPTTALAQPTRAGTTATAASPPARAAVGTAGSPGRATALRCRSGTGPAHSGTSPTHRLPRAPRLPTTPRLSLALPLVVALEVTYDVRRLPLQLIGQARLISTGH